MEEVQALLNKYLAVQGGVYGAMLTMAWALPLEQLQGSAKAGVVHANAVGRDLDWVYVFWLGIPHWLPPSERSKHIASWSCDIKRAAEDVMADMQHLGLRKVTNKCQSCGGLHAVTLFPSLTQCCGDCERSGGAEHGPKCLQQPMQGKRTCDNCDFLVTFDPRF